MVSLLSQLPPRRRGIRAAVAYLDQVPAVFRVLSWPRGSLQRSIGGTMMAVGYGIRDSVMSSCVPALGGTVAADGGWFSPDIQ